MMSSNRRKYRLLKILTWYREPGPTAFFNGLKLGHIHQITDLRLYGVIRLAVKVLIKFIRIFLFAEFHQHHVVVWFAVSDNLKIKNGQIYGRQELGTLLYVGRGRDLLLGNRSGRGRGKSSPAWPAVDGRHIYIFNNFQ